MLLEWVRRLIIMVDKMEEFVITKKIAKQGSQQMILLPVFLRDEIPSGSLVKVTIEVIDKA